MSETIDGWPEGFGPTREEVEDIFYFTFTFQTLEDMADFIKKIPVKHGPIRKRGKGKVNRDWEN